MLQHNLNKYGIAGKKNIKRKWFKNEFFFTIAICWLKNLQQHLKWLKWQCIFIALFDFITDYNCNDLMVSIPIIKPFWKLYYIYMKKYKYMRMVHGYLLQFWHLIKIIWFIGTIFNRRPLTLSFNGHSIEVPVNVYISLNKIFRF